MPWTQMPRIEKPPRPAPMRPSRISPPKRSESKSPPKPPGHAALRLTVAQVTPVLIHG